MNEEMIIRFFFLDNSWANGIWIFSTCAVHSRNITLYVNNGNFDVTATRDVLSTYLFKENLNLIFSLLGVWTVKDFLQDTEQYKQEIKVFVY